MKSLWGCAIFLMLLVCRSARPDTIITTDGSSVNGSILGVANDVVKIQSRFPSKTKEIWVPLKDIQSLEFNSQTFNPGAPPKIQGFGPASTQDSQQKSNRTGEVIVLRGGERQPCNLVDIDADAVHCGPHDTFYPRNKVLRVVFGS
jgi:hypothetical protein